MISRVLEGRTIVEKPPAGMSSPEFEVYRELRRRDEPFTMQVDFGGGIGYRGGMRVDFLLTSRPVVIRVMSYWHTLPGAFDRDVQQRIYLEAQGYTVLDLTEEEIRVDVAAALDMKLGVIVP